MAYLFGGLLFHFLVGFLIAHFAIAKPYEKKNGEKYNGGLKILFTLLFAFASFILGIIGRVI